MDEENDCILIERKPECIEIDESDDDQDTEKPSIVTETTDNEKLIELVVSSTTPRPDTPIILNELLAKRLEVNDTSHSHFQLENENMLLLFVETKLTSDYDKLNIKNQRNFKRRCLELLHELLNEQDLLHKPKRTKKKSSRDK